MTEKNRVWLVKANKKILGPYSVDEVEELIRRHQINLLDELHNSKKRWTYLREIEDFKEVVDQVQKEILTTSDATRTVQGATTLVYNKDTDSNIKTDNNLINLKDVSPPSSEAGVLQKAEDLPSVEVKKTTDIPFKEEPADVNKEKTKLKKEKIDYAFSKDPEIKKVKNKRWKKVLKILLSFVVLCAGLFFVLMSYFWQQKNKSTQFVLDKLYIAYEYSLTDEFLDYYNQLQPEQISQNEFVEKIPKYWSLLDKQGRLNLDENKKNQIINNKIERLKNPLVTKASDKFLKTELLDLRDYKFSEVYDLIDQNNYTKASAKLTEINKIFTQLAASNAELVATLNELDIKLDIELNKQIINLIESHYQDAYKGFKDIYEKYHNSVAFKGMLYCLSQLSQEDSFVKDSEEQVQTNKYISNEIDKLLLTQVVIFPEFLLYKMQEELENKNQKSFNDYFYKYIDLIPQLNQKMVFNYSFYPKFLLMNKFDNYLNQIKNHIDSEQLALIKAKLDLEQSLFSDFSQDLDVVKEKEQFKNLVEKLQMQKLIVQKNEQELTSLLKTIDANNLSMSDLLSLFNILNQNNKASDKFIYSEQLQARLKDEEVSFKKMWAQVILASTIDEKFKLINEKSFYSDTLNYFQQIRASHDGLYETAQ